MESILYVWLGLICVWCLWQVLRLIGKMFSAIGGGFSSAVEKTKASNRAAAESRQRTTQENHQRRRKQARAAIELLYQQNEIELKERLPKATFDDFLVRHMGDDHEVGYVEAWARKLRDQIQAHLERVRPPEQNTVDQLALARAEVQAFYDEHKEIHPQFPPRALQAELRVRIPSTATPEQAWAEARAMIEELHKVVSEVQIKSRPQPSRSVNPPLQNI